MSKKYARLWIPEKPSVGRDLVKALCRTYSARVVNQKSASKDGFTLLSNDDVVCSVFGHMIQMLPPSRYFTKEQNSNLMDSLPLIPDPFKFEPATERTKDGKPMVRGGKPVVSKRYLLLEKLIKQSKEIVNACDIDREGQLIFDGLIRHVGEDPYADNMLRTSIVSMTPEALDKAARELDKNNEKKWHGKGMAAEARQKMDWLLGMNASMAYQVVTGIRTMSVGRVQTPVLSLVVERDELIDNFKPQTYYVPVVVMKDGTRLRWDKREGAENQQGFDPNGRIIDKKLAQAIVDKIASGQAGEVLVSKIDERSESPPLPFSMGALQTEASKRNGLSVAQVTKAAQNLYEKHKAITYVGTDCRFIPEEMYADAPDVLRKLAESHNKEATGANPAIKSKAFNDNKIDEHFAILPTGNVPNLSASESAEKAVYDTICKRYIAQFYPDYRYASGSLGIAFGDDQFKATARKDIDIGWKAVEGNNEKGKARKSSSRKPKDEDKSNERQTKGG